jgi:NAD(P)-dependent dehydrogenase (short-subunit alcohol dehydrogenase family)
MKDTPRIVLTGAYGIFGVHIAEGLVAAGCDLICVCRNQQKAEDLMQCLKSKYPNASCRFELCDVSSHEDVRRLGQNLAGTPIDVLVNNAAITPTSREETKAGIEQQWACNVLGYHWMLKALEPSLMASRQAPARVVNVASFYAGGLDLNDVEFKKRGYCPDSAYQASKQANRMMAAAYTKRYPADKIVFFSCHPGVATSPVSLGLGFDLDRSERAQKEGAVTPLHLCLDPSVAQHNGAYFNAKKPENCRFCADTGAVDRLYSLLESYP